MPVPNPAIPVKVPGPPCGFITGAATLMRTRFPDVDWSRLAKVKDLTPGELTAGVL